MRTSLIYALILSMSVLSSSCFKVDEKLATKQAPAGDILFSVPDAALPAAPTGQPQVVQPTYYLVGANFSLAGNVDITVAMPSTFTKLTVNYVNVTTGVREQKASLTGLSESVEWNTYPVNTLGPGNSKPAAKSTISLEFIASNDDGSLSTTRVFTVTVTP